MKAIVDQDTCIGCEACTAICPSIFHMNEDYKSEASENEIPEDCKADANEACETCPVGAIEILN